MRDLRAELREWNNDEPIRWQPDDGNILVGFLREPPRADDEEPESRTVIIEEERTGIPVAVSLDSPVLSGLFDLHSPRCDDRIGLKFTGIGPDGVRRYVMVVDREYASAPGEHNDETGATCEERDFIENMMCGESSGQDVTAPDSSPITSFTHDRPISSNAPNPAKVIIILLTMLLTGALLATCPDAITSLFH